MIKILLRVLAIMLIGLFCAVDGFFAGALISGYEVGGPIGLLLGALIGLVGSVWLFGRRKSKV
jgi:hypothetical protein